MKVRHATERQDPPAEKEFLMPGHPTASRLAAFSHIPIVDISAARDPARRADLATQVVSVAEEVGFMYIVGHGIGDDILDGVFDMSRRFFDLPDAEKRTIHISRSPQYRGYLGLLEKGNTDPSFKGNNLEAFHCATELADTHPDVRAGMPLRGPNLWPSAPDGSNRGGAPRFSIPFFMTPDFDAVLKPLGSDDDPDAPTFCVGEEMLNTYRRIWPPPAA
jgi:isopenicillin N synthase-like dioxygenase